MMKLAIGTILCLILPGSGIRSATELAEELLSDSKHDVRADLHSVDSADWFGLIPREKCRNKPQTRGWHRPRRSCTQSWAKAGRCAWVDGNGCVTNCNHRHHQTERLCDPVDCEWSAAWSSCSFKDSVTTSREGFCGAVTKLLDKDQLTFCDGVAVATAGMKLEPMEQEIDVMSFMGCWYVQANIPTFLDAGSSNNIELYTWNSAKQRIDVTFQYTKNGKDILSYQKGWVDNEKGTLWRLHPRLLWIYWPFNLPYVLIHVDANYTESIVGYPDRSYLWIMTREVNPNATKVQELIGIAENLGYRREDMNMVKNDIPETPAICPGR